MASTYFQGKGGVGSHGDTSTQHWHAGPTMDAAGTLEGSRNGSTISGRVVDAWCSRSRRFLWI